MNNHGKKIHVWSKKLENWDFPGLDPFPSSVTQTDGSEAMVERGRVSIRDNHTSHSFTVTLSGVTAGDAGSYSCWVKRHWLYNPRHTIEVMVSAVVSITAESNNVRLLTTNPLCITDSAELPVLSHPGVTHLLLFLSVKLLLALALVCGVAWVRSRRRSRDQENLQLLEVAGSTAALSSPPEPQ
ncbi:CMRF35-like molecule 6 [Phaenicophaeus curvirostris]|uniref:CMRF35-like molecule 6 n=1 Tax=Phaenicophaeus curvirostris TaxID=33595 RepID=UPI0037F0973D